MNILVDGKVVATVPAGEYQEYVIAQIVSNLQYDNKGTVTVEEAN